MRGGPPRVLQLRQSQKREAIRRTQKKTLKSSYKNHKLSDESTVLERVGIWAAGSLFLDDLEKMLQNQGAKIGVFWGPPEPGMKSLATLYFHKKDGQHEVIQILMAEGRYPDVKSPGDLTRRMGILLDQHKVEIGLRWSHGIPVVQITCRISKVDFSLVMLQGAYGRRVLFEGQ